MSQDEDGLSRQRGNSGLLIVLQGLEDCKGEKQSRNETHLSAETAGSPSRPCHPTTCHLLGREGGTKGLESENHYLSCAGRDHWAQLLTARWAAQDSHHLSNSFVQMLLERPRARAPCLLAWGACFSARPPSQGGAFPQNPIRTSPEPGDITYSKKALFLIHPDTRKASTPAELLAVQTFSLPSAQGERPLPHQSWARAPLPSLTAADFVDLPRALVLAVLRGTA